MKPTVTAPRSSFRHWLATLNAALAVFIGGAFAAPIFAAAGHQNAADQLYAAYRYACHEWAFRSFFLYAPGQPPLAVYSEQQLSDLGTDPYRFVGNAALGWKMAFCERDLAIYVGLLAVGLYFARRRDLQPMSFIAYGVLILPMALDGFTQLFGWRESTWELRVSTGIIFGLASAWLVLPRLDVAFGLRPEAQSSQPPATPTRQPASTVGARPASELSARCATTDAVTEPASFNGKQYSPDAVCEPVPLPDPEPQLSPRG